MRLVSLTLCLCTFLQEVEIFKRCREEMRQLLAAASNHASCVSVYPLHILIDTY